MKKSMKERERALPVHISVETVVVRYELVLPLVVQLAFEVEVLQPR